MSIKYTVESNALVEGTYYPRPFAISTRNLEVLVRDISNATTVSEPDVEAVIKALRSAVVNGLADGDRVSIDGLVDFRARMSQVLDSGAGEFDTQAGGQLLVAATIKPSLTRALRKAASFEKLEHGDKAPLPKSLFNSATGSTGQYTPGDIADLVGRNLRVFDAQAPDEGVFFVAVSDGTETKVAGLHHNANRKLTFLIPQALTGQQRVQVRTRYTEDGTLRVGELKAILDAA